MDKEEQLSSRFTHFATIECKGISEMYEYLSLEISKDAQILALCSHARSGQPVPNLLFGSVHYLLLQGIEHPLKDFYPSLNADPMPVDQSFVYFKDFCNTYEDEIISLLKSKLVQTNEVRRCAYLYPVFCWIYNQTKKPLSLIEIGTSAGLQLLWNHYSYSYGSEDVYGKKHSRVHITSEIKGENQPLLLTHSPPVISKVGVDLHTNDLLNPDDYLWLKALIWPEHQDRRELFDKAASLFREHPVELREGDGISLLPMLEQSAPEDSTICIFHTHVANQLSEQLKYKLLETVHTIGEQRDVFHIYNNIWDGKLHLDYMIQGVWHNQLVGETEPHGKWFEWNLVND